MKIIKGKYWECLKNIKASTPRTSCQYRKGKIYLSKSDNYISDESGNSYNWSIYPETEFLRMFKPYYNHKRKSKFPPSEKS